jgi:6-phosphogluconolactonase
MQPEVGSALPRQVVIGGYTTEMDGRAAGLTSLRPRSDGTGLEVVDTLELPSPTFLVAHPHQPRLFAVSESEPGQVSSVWLHPDGALTLLSSVPTGGDGSCHLALSPDASFLVVADYVSGSVSSVPVGQDGRLGDRVDRHPFEGAGPDPDRQRGPHAHQVVWDGDELLVPDLGTDRIHRLRLDAAGRFAVAAAPVLLPAGSGPRHLVVVEDHLVVAAELSGELWLGRRLPGGGWTDVDRVRCSGTAGGGELYPSALRADGDTVFVANRGPGTVAAFALDRPAGTLTLTAEVDGGGRWPRDLVVTDDWLWVANQTDDVVTRLPRRDGAAPTLRVSSPTPACVLLPSGPGDSLSA